MIVLSFIQIPFDLIFCGKKRKYLKIFLYSFPIFAGKRCFARSHCQYANLPLCLLFIVIPYFFDFCQYRFAHFKQNLIKKPQNFCEACTDIYEAEQSGYRRRRRGAQLDSLFGWIYQIKTGKSAFCVCTHPVFFIPCLLGAHHTGYRLILILD